MGSRVRGQGVRIEEGLFTAGLHIFLGFVRVPLWGFFWGWEVEFGVGGREKGGTGF